MEPQPTRFRSDAFWSSAGTVVPIVAGAASIPFILASLGLERFAVYALALAIISFAPSFDFGISKTAFRRIAAMMASDASLVPAMTNHALLRARKAGLAAAALLTPAVLAVLAYGATESQITAAVIWPIVVAMLAVPAAVIGNTQRAVLEGARRFRTSAGARIGLGLLSALLPALLCLVTDSVLLLTVSLLALRIVAVSYQQGILRAQGLVSYSERSRNTAFESDTGSPLTFRTESSWYAIAAPVSLLMSGFDRFIVLALTTLTLADLSILVAPQEVALRAIILPAAIIPAIMVRIAPHNAEPEKTRSLLLTVFMAVVGLSLAGCIMLSMGAPPIADIVFRSLPAQQLIPIIQVLCIGIFSNAVAQFPAAALNGRGMSNIPAVLQLIELPFFIVALPYLVLSFGPLGAAIAWSARIVVDTFMLLLSADVKTPAIAIKRWHLIHCIGLVALMLPILT